MKNKIILSLFIFSVILTSSFIAYSHYDITKKKSKKDVAVKEITWKNFDEINQLNASKSKKVKTKKKIFIDIYTNWCGWCKQLDKTTFKDSTVIVTMNKYFHANKLNAESSNTIVYKGKNYSEAEFSATVLRANAYPTCAILDENFEVIKVIPGYLDAKKMDKLLNYFGKDLYKTMTWSQYEAQ